MKTLPAFVHRPMTGELTVYAVCLENTGSKRLHRFSMAPTQPPPAVGMKLRIDGKTYRVEQVEKA